MFSRWRDSVRLRLELESAQIQAAELASLSAENRRLAERQISPAALEVLQADHAALPRLRSELEILEKAAHGAQP